MAVPLSDSEILMVSQAQACQWRLGTLSQQSVTRRLLAQTGSPTPGLLTVLHGIGCPPLARPDAGAAAGSATNIQVSESGKSLILWLHINPVLPRRSSKDEEL